MTALAPTLLWLTVLLPAVVGAVLCLAPRLDRPAARVSVGTATLFTGLTLLVAGSRPSVSTPFMAGADLGLTVDALAAPVLPTVALVTLLVLVFSVADVEDSPARFHGLMLLFASSAAMTVTASTLPTLLFAWEVMGATSYALIGFWWQQESRLGSGLTAFVTTRTGDLGLYLAAGAALAGGAGLTLVALPSAPEPWRTVVAVGILVAALGKAAQLPFSFWLSRAMDGPSPVSALLHSAAMVAMGGYLLLRVEPLLAATGVDLVAAWAGALTALLLGAVAVAQRDLKQLLAASTAAQLGFVVLAAGVGAVGGGAAHLVAHASTKALLFLVAGAWLTALGTKSLAGLTGVARRWRTLGALASVGALSLGGIAPLALWWTKDAVLASALEESPLLYGVGLAAAMLSAAYAGKLLLVVWRRSPGRHHAAMRHLDEERPGRGEVRGLEQWPLVPLAVGAIVLGLLALSAVPVLPRALRESVVHPGALEMAASATLGLLVLLAVLRWGVREPRLLRSWLGLEAAATLLVVRPVDAAATWLAHVDDRYLDRAVDVSAAWTMRLADWSQRADDDGVDGGVERLAGWFRAAGRWARRPQGGLLHRYYVQAALLLVLGVLIVTTVR